MADIFGRKDMVYGGGFVSDTGVIQDGGGITGILMQNLQVQYQRPITKIFELGKAGANSNVYYVEGRPQGTLTIARVIGFSATIGAFYTKYGNACNAAQNNMSLNMTSAQCGGTGKQIGLTMHACVLTGVGFSIQAQQLVINENSSMEFANMSYTGQ